MPTRLAILITALYVICMAALHVPPPNEMLSVSDQIVWPDTETVLMKMPEVKMTSDQQLRYRCFSEAMRDFFQYKKKEGEEKMKLRITKSGLDWQDYQNMLVSGLTRICYNEKKG